MECGRLRPKSYRLPTSEESFNLEEYLGSVDRLVFQRVVDNKGGLFHVCNSSGQPVLKVCKTSNRIFLLKDLNERTLWSIQMTKNWTCSPSTVDVSNHS